MMSRLWSPRGLCAAILLLSREVTVARRDSSKCLPDYIGDGDCDAENNRLECHYDGGDCCFCTCRDGSLWDCGANGYDCLDPTALCLVDDDDGHYDDSSFSSTTHSSTAVASKYCLSSFIGDGECDATNNVEACDYDGGDCCECTCVSGRYHCGGGALGYQCVDPDGLYCPPPTPSPSPNPTPAPTLSPTPAPVTPFELCHFSRLSPMAWWTPSCWTAWWR